MRKILLVLLTFLVMGVSGCGVEWFPDQETTTDDGSSNGSSSTVAAFSFTPKTNVTAGTEQTSDPVTLSITGNPAAITVTGAGSYSIGEGAFTKESGTVSNGAVIRVRHTHPAGATQVTTTVTVGDKSSTFTTTTAPTSSTGVTQFSFAPKTNVTPATEQLSETVTITMSGSAAEIGIAGGEYQIGSGAFTSADGSISNGQTVKVRHTSPTAEAVIGGASGQTVTTLVIGDKSGTFTSTAIVVEPFSFTAKTGVPVNTTQVSDQITVKLLSGTAAPISVSSGEYSINGGAYTSTAGTVRNNETVTVRHTSFSVAGHDVITTLTIGAQSATFKSTTGA